jgi:hypothetical protein
VLLGKGTPVDWRKWIRRIIPLTLGLGASHFLLSADMIVVRILFEENQTGTYAAVGMIGRGLVIFTTPLAAVMFPKIVRSIALTEKTNVMVKTLGATALLAGMMAAGFTVLSWLIPPMLDLAKNAGSWFPGGLREKLLYHEYSFLFAGRLLPWFVWCMWPLTLNNVLLVNLLAKERYEAIPWLVVTVAGYATALSVFHESFVMVIQTLGVFNLLLLGVTAWFTWRK